MKEFIKRLLPDRARPTAKRLSQGLRRRPSSFDLSGWNFDRQTVLRCIVSYNKYGGYCVPERSRHRPAAQKILSNDVYEPRTIEFITSNCGNGDIVHAGTYFGDFLPALSKGCAANSIVWAFEPNSENYRCADITLQINDVKNVVLTNAGVGSKRERLPMKTADRGGCALGGASHIVARDSGALHGTETIQVVTIDDTIEPNRTVSIIQLDVEGHEKQALIGALETIRRCLPIIILETLPGSTLVTSDWFRENVLSLGYRMANAIQGNTVFTCQPKD